MESQKLVFLGDHHLREFNTVCEKNGDDLNFGVCEKNVFWNTQSSVTIKHLKASYGRYKLESGIPDIVVLGAGSHDLCHVGTVNCVISSLVRFMKLMKKDGVKAVIILSLVERQIPPPYNDYVRRVNAVIISKAKHADGVFYLPYLRKYEHDGSDFEKNGKLLVEQIYLQFYGILKKCLTKKVSRYIKSLSKNEHREDTTGFEVSSYAASMRELETETEISLLQNSVQNVVFRQNILENKKKILLESLNNVNNEAQSQKECITNLRNVVRALENSFTDVNSD